MFSLFDVVNELLAFTKRDDSEEESEDCFGLVNTRRQASGSRRSIVRRIGRHMPARRKKTFRNRSLVRVIGSALPIKPCRRAYFQVFEESRKKWTSQAKCFISDNFDNVYSKVPSLADVGGLLDASNTECDEERTTILTRAKQQQASGLDLIKCEYEGDDSWLSEYDESDSEDTCVSQQQQSDKSDQNGLKISTLEQELAQLRMQIASIITNPNATQATEANQDSQMAPIPVQCPPVPPPPPPPPMSTIAWKEQTKLAADTPRKATVKAAFSDILKDISTVKLKSIDSNRSPGGTPIKKLRKPRQSSSNAVDIITLALQKKFAKSMNVTPEKENTLLNDSFESPEKNNSSLNRSRSTSRRRSLLSRHTISQSHNTENVNMIR